MQQQMTALEQEQADLKVPPPETPLTIVALAAPAASPASPTPRPMCPPPTARNSLLRLPCNTPKTTLLPSAAPSSSLSVCGEGYQHAAVCTEISIVAARIPPYFPELNFN
jgi:hypothetical protein